MSVESEAGEVERELGIEERDVPTPPKALETLSLVGVLHAIGEVVEAVSVTGKYVWSSFRVRHKQAAHACMRVLTESKGYCSLC